MPFNGLGQYEPLDPPVFPAVAGTTIKSAEYNDQINDLGAALSMTITSNGESVLTGNIPMAGFRFTGAGDAVGAGEYMTKRQLAVATGIYAGGYLLGYTEGGAASTVGAALDHLIEASSVADYTALRAYTGSSKQVYVSGVVGTAAPNETAGYFVLDAADTTSADNGGTIIVTTTGSHRYKRAALQVTPEMFGAVSGTGKTTPVKTANTVALTAWFNCVAQTHTMRRNDDGTARTYEVNGQIVIGNKSGKIYNCNGAVINRTTAPALTDDFGVVFVLCNDIVVRQLGYFGANETMGKLEGQSHNFGVYGCTALTLDQCRSTYGTCDGFYLNRIASGATVAGITASSTVESDRILMTGCYAAYNARQGMSVICMRKMRVENCDFSYTGVSTAGLLAPAAGVDIEPLSAAYPCYEIEFSSCRFLGNSGSGLTCALYTKMVRVSNCTFTDGTSYGISIACEWFYGSNIYISNTGATSRPCIDIDSPAAYRSRIVLENVYITSAIFGAISRTDGNDLYLKNITVEDSANYGLRCTGGGLSTDKGLLDINGMKVYRLYANTPPTSSACFFGATDSIVYMRNCNAVRASATGTPIERGINVNSYSNLREISCCNSEAAFATTVFSGPVVAKRAFGNTIDLANDEAANKSGSATYNPPNLAVGASAITTVTVTGANFGDMIEGNFSISLQGVTLTWYVSTTNTVTFVFFNGTAAPIDLASGTLTAQARKL